MGKLDHLFLNNNMLTKLWPKVLGELKRLEIINLSDNPLAHLYRDTFQNLTSLKWLGLRTQLTILTREHFLSFAAIEISGAVS